MSPTAYRVRRALSLVGVRGPQFEKTSDSEGEVLEQGVIWPVRIAPMAPGRGLYKDSALFSLTIDPGVHGSPWSTRRSIGANCADCVRCNAWLTVATVYIGSEFARLW